MASIPEVSGIGFIPPNSTVLDILCKNRQLISFLVWFLLIYSYL